MIVVSLFAVGLALSFALGAVVRRVAPRLGGVVPARADRWHREPTPTFGGVAIAAATAGVGAVALLVWGTPATSGDAWLVLGAAAALFAVGFADDRLRLTALTKLLASLTVGSFLLFGLARINQAPVTWWATVLVVIGYAGIVHAFNLLDNMDGLAGSIAVISAFALAVVFEPALGPMLVLALVAFAGGVTGFLVWNVRPARLFMGDCGSLFLGAIIGGAGLAILVRPGGSFAKDGFALCLALIVPLLDTSFVLVLRRLAGRPATRGGTDHLSHRLVSAGLSEVAAVAVLAVLGLTGGAAAWFMFRGGWSNLPEAALFLVGVLLAGLYLARVPAYDGEDFQALQKVSFAPFLRDLTFRWHALEMLLDVVLISAVFYGSYRLRFEDEALSVFLPSFTASLPIVLGCKLVALYLSGVYSRMWDSFSLRDIFAIVRGVAAGSVASIFAAAYLYRFERFSRGVFIIDAAILTLVLILARGSFRIMREAANGRHKHARRVLIYGAGSAGQLLVREMFANADWGLRPVAFLDDDLGKHRRRLMGIPIRGGAYAVESVLLRARAEEVVISTATIAPDYERHLREVCARLQVPVRRFRLEITD